MPVSTVTYNGYSFPATRVSVSETPVYAEDKLTVIGTLYEFKIGGWILANSQTEFNSTLATLQAKTREPRKDFALKWAPDGGAEVTYYSFTAATEDAWGPLPGPLSFQNVTGGLAAPYEWSLKCFRRDCFTEACVVASRPGKILAFTHTYEHSVDHNGYTTRTISGKLTVSEDGAPADAWRKSLTPPLPKRFRRKSATFQQSVNSLELTFTFVDEEMYLTYPMPVTNGQATWTIHPMVTGVYADYTLSGYFEATPNRTKKEVLQAIVGLYNYKFSKARTAGAQALIFEELQFVEHLYSSNRIDFSIRARGAYGDRANTVDFLPSWTLAHKVMGLEETTEDRNILGPYGHDTGDNGSGIAGGLPQIADPCNDTVSSAPIPSNYPGSPSESDTTTTPTESPDQSANSGLSASHESAPYLEYHETISYEYDSGAVTFDPKDQTKPPIFQRAHAPRLVVIQAGYAKRYGTDISQQPALPAPILGSSGCILQTFIAPSVPTPLSVGGGWKIYGISWRYIMRYTGTLSTGWEAEPQYPADPRMSDDNSWRAVSAPGGLNLVQVG